MESQSLQEKYAPRNMCFGCGVANTDGLHCWIIVSLFECNCNATSAYYLMKRAGENRPPCTVTAEYAIKLLRPTPTSDRVLLSAKVVEITDDRAIIEGTLSAGGKVCATCRGVFVAVKEGHPAYHRW